MNILGIHDGHLSTACLVKDGDLRYIISEERFNRIKSYGGPPVESIKWILKESGLDAGDIDLVALIGLIDPISSIESYKTSRHKYYSSLVRVVPSSLSSSPTLTNMYINYMHNKRKTLSNIKDLLKEVKIPRHKVKIVEHHEAHAASAYYLSGFIYDNKPSLVITLDGSGDGLCGTVCTGNNLELKRIHTISSFNSIGNLYSRITQYLGMKPLEHEYKLMGLAPYAPEKLSNQAYNILKTYISLSSDGLSFVNHTRRWGNSLLDKLKDDLFQVRFDAVSAGLQKLFEELVLQFIINWIKKTGIHRLVLGGGCFMNVKLNMLIAQHKEVDDLFIMPSGGDESTPVGGALKLYVDNNRNSKKIKPLKELYFGHAYTDKEIEEELSNYKDQIEFEKSDNIEEKSAKLLSQHKIIGRFKGKMEFGARALGNRSIIANPSNLDNLRKLNKAIKMRDYWMPFAPSVLWEKRKDYTSSDKDIPSPYMLLAFESTELARKDLLASLHPYDLTCRPQLVMKEWNESYHNLISEFEKITGIGGVLNTSFNLHGYPIVCSPKDAITTFLKSDLDYITIEDYLLWKV